MAELVDAADLKSASQFESMGSSPFIGTAYFQRFIRNYNKVITGLNFAIVSPLSFSPFLKFQAKWEF